MDCDSVGSCELYCAPLIEVLQSDRHYVLSRAESSLWFSRLDGSVVARDGPLDSTVTSGGLFNRRQQQQQQQQGRQEAAAAAEQLVCIGVCEGLVGRLQTHVDGPYYLLLARDSEPAGVLASGHQVRRLSRVVCLPLTAPHSPPPPPHRSAGGALTSSATAAAAATGGAGGGGGGGGGSGSTPQPAVGEYQLLACEKHCGCGATVTTRSAGAAVSSPGASLSGAAAAAAVSPTNQSSCPSPSSSSLSSSPSSSLRLGGLVRGAARRVTSASAQVRGRVASGLRRTDSPTTTTTATAAAAVTAGAAGAAATTNAGDTNDGLAHFIAARTAAAAASAATLSTAACTNQLLDDVLKLLNDTDSFYFSVGGDITATVQRWSDRSAPVATRFIWNWALVQCLRHCSSPLPPDGAVDHTAATGVGEGGDGAAAAVNATTAGAPAAADAAAATDGGGAAGGGCDKKECVTTSDGVDDSSAVNSDQSSIQQQQQQQQQQEDMTTAQATAAAPRPSLATIAGPATGTEAGTEAVAEAGSDVSAEDLEVLSSPWLLALIQGFYQSVDVYWPAEQPPPPPQQQQQQPPQTTTTPAVAAAAAPNDEFAAATATIDNNNNSDSDGSGDSECERAVCRARHFCLTLVSRRSRHRAGARYLCRGVDSAGHVANYVETEQILSCGSHHLSYVQVRGSVPVFWSQPGSQFRPPPLVHALAPDVTQRAFSRHLAAELRNYSRLHLVSLVDLSGRERALADAYLDCVLTYDSEAVTFTAFDFHEHCRGLRFENVACLIGSLSEALAAGGFTWSDQHGCLRRQTTIVRTNCVDCLDRTNVVQTALARQMLDRQLAKLGVLQPPPPQLPRSSSSLTSVRYPTSSTAAAAAEAVDPIRAVFQELWADNGDAISRQYAGTGALKADFTRTGERRLAGMIGDGVRSANRYYLKRFRDAGRQVAIDVLLGRPVASASTTLTNTTSTASTTVTTAATPATVSQPPAAAAAALPSDSDTTDGRVGVTSAVDDEVAAGPRSESTVDPDDVERVRQLLHEAISLLVGDESRVLGAWAMMDASEGGAASSCEPPAAPPPAGLAGPVPVEPDTVLLLTDNAYMVAAYDDTMDRMVAFQTVPLSDLCGIDLVYPPPPAAAAAAAPAAATAGRSLLRQAAAAAAAASVSLSALSPRSGAAGSVSAAGTGDASSTRATSGGQPASPAAAPAPVHCLRLHYRIGGQAGYFHQLRAAGVRFFNNTVPLPVSGGDQQAEACHAIGQVFLGAHTAHQQQEEQDHQQQQQQQQQLELREIVWDNASSRPLDSGEEVSSGAMMQTTASRRDRVFSFLRSRCQRQKQSLPRGRGLWSMGVTNVAGVGGASIDAPTVSDDFVSLSADGHIAKVSQTADVSARLPRNISAGRLLDTGQCAGVLQHRLADNKPISDQNRSCSSPLPLPEVGVVVSVTSDEGAGGGGTVSDCHSSSLAGRLGEVLSPLTSPARDTMLSSFSLLARGVQRLAPSHGQRGAGSGSSTPTPTTSSSARKRDIDQLLRDRIAGSRSRIVLL